MDRILWKGCTMKELRMFWNLLSDMWSAITGQERCNEKLFTQGEIHYCQKKLGHKGRCKTYTNREFN